MFRSQMKRNRILKQFTIKRGFPPIPLWYTFLFLILTTFNFVRFWGKNASTLHMYMFENTEKDNKQVKHTKKKIVISKFDNFYTAKDSSNSIGNLIKVNLFQNLFFLQNMGRTCCAQKNFWMSQTISVHNMFSPGLSLEISYIELVIQWTICHHIVG